MVAAALLLATPPAFAQGVEASFNVGYSASEGISTENRPILAASYDTLAVDSGASLNFTFGYLFNDNMGVEFLWARQNSRLQADGPAGKLPFSELAVYNYMFNFVYNWGERDARVRPYFFGGIGATNYSFDQLLVATPLAGTQIESETRFATNWGGGVKFYVSPKVGVKVGLRWTPTYIKSDPAGVWCDPFYGCWQLVDNDYSNQFETAAGITFRF
jgi:opacity protein-like surface antigen